MTISRTAAGVGLCLFAAWLAPPAAADAPQAPGARVADPTLAPRLVRRSSRGARWAAYRPAVPQGETRSAWTAIAVSPTPFALTAGEALTPVCGRVGLGFSRVSDERFMIDDAGRRWDSDGEVQIVDLEVVGPRTSVVLGGRRIPFHWSASIHAYSLEHALYDRLRNFVEEDLLGSTPFVIANHDIGGRDLAIAGEDVLESAPLLKVRGGIKVPLPSTQLLCRALHSALSVGLTLPAFGWKRESGNDSLQPDVTWAWHWDLTRAWQVSGAVTASLPGSTERFDRLGVATRDVLVGGNVNVAWWFNPCWAVALGFQAQSPYLEDTGLAMDDASTYANLAVLWRPTPRHTFHLVFSENPQGNIVFGAGRDYTGAQRDADFTILIGWRMSF